MNLKKIGSLDTLYIPFKKDTKSKHLMIILHGLGDSLEGFLNFPDWLGIENLDYLLVNAPRPYHTGYEWFGVDSPQRIEQAEQSCEALEQVLKAIEKDYKKEQIILFGFSQGGFMALHLGFQSSELFCGLIGVSTFYPSELFESIHIKAKQQKILVTHGTYDPVISMAETKTQIEKLKSLEFNITWKEYEKEHNLDTKNELPDLRDFINTLLK